MPYPAASSCRPALPYLALKPAQHNLCMDGDPRTSNSPPSRSCVSGASCVRAYESSLTCCRDQRTEQAALGPRGTRHASLAATSTTPPPQGTVPSHIALHCASHVLSSIWLKWPTQHRIPRFSSLSCSLAAARGLLLVLGPAGRAHRQGSLPLVAFPLFVCLVLFFFSLSLFFSAFAFSVNVFVRFRPRKSHPGRAVNVHTVINQVTELVANITLPPMKRLEALLAHG